MKRDVKLAFCVADLLKLMWMSRSRSADSSMNTESGSLGRQLMDRRWQGTSESWTTDWSKAIKDPDVALIEIYAPSLLRLLVAAS